MINAESADTVDHVFAVPKPVDKEENQDLDILENKEFDLASTSFDDLLGYISGKDLQELFKKVLFFLKSNEDELEFPGIFKPWEEILIRIIKDVNVLKSQVLSGCSNYFAKCLFNTIMCGRSQRKYRLVCVYKTEPQDQIRRGLHEGSENILVYKKLHYQIFECYSSSSVSNTSVLSRTSSIESINSQRSFTLPTDSFLSHCLKLMLKFVKHKTQHQLQLIDLSPTNADYLYTLFSNIIDNNFDNGLGGKNLFTPLWEAVKLFSLKYEFCIRLGNGSDDRKSLLLEKNPKMNPSDNAGYLPSEEGTKTDQPECDEFINRAELRSMKAKEKKMRRRLGLGAITKLLSPEFMNQSLNKMLTFLSDETEASVIFTQMEPQGKRFVKNIFNYSRSDSLKMHFDEDARCILNQIEVLIAPNANYKINIREKSNDCGDKDLTFMKVPRFDPTSKTSRPSSVMETNKEVKSPAITSETSKDLKRPPTSNPNITFQSAGALIQKNKENSIILETEKDPLLLAAIKRHEASMTNILSHSNGHETPIWPPKVPKPNVGYGKAQRNVQLIEALSVPVKIDKAIRMMRSMGWKGGALGSKENGITEPIMPQLNVASGAGLGHSKTQTYIPKASTPVSSNSTSKKNIGNFRHEFLQLLLDFLISNNEKTTVQTQSKLKKKEKGFLCHVLRAFAARKKITMAPEVQELLDKVTQEYGKETDLIVNACISDDKKEITLRKLHNHVQLLSANDKRKQKNSMADFSDNIELIMSSYGSLCHTQKTQDSTKFRVEVLMKILDFIKNDYENCVKVTIIRAISQKEKRFITTSIMGINKKLKFGSCTPVLMLSMELRKYMGNYQLVLNTGLCYFTVTKVNFIKKNIDNNERNNNATKVNDFVQNEKTAAKKQPKDQFKYVYVKEIEYGDPDDKKIIEIDGEIAENNDKMCTNVSASTSNEKMTEIDHNINNNDTLEKNNTSDSNISKNNDKIATDIVPPVMANEDVIKPSNTDTVLNNMPVNNENDDKNTGDERNEAMNDVPDMNDNKSETSAYTSEYMIEEMSMSDHSGYTLDYSETDFEDDVSMDDDGAKVNDNATKLSDVKTEAAVEKGKIGDDGIETVNEAIKLEVDEIMNEKLSDEMMNEKPSDDRAESSDNQVECDKLDISLKSELIITMSNVDLIEQPQIEKSKNDVKINYLTKDYFLAKDIPKYIQGLISLNIVQTKELPLLKCHGVQNGALVYSCHTKKSHDWLSNMCVANNITMITKEFDKMRLKINSFFEFDDKYFFNMLELYNKELSTVEWVILKKEVLEDSVVFDVKMDKLSFKLILDSDLELYAGVDKVTFSIIFE